MISTAAYCESSYLLHACDGVCMSLHQAGGRLGLRLCRAADLEKTTQKGLQQRCWAKPQI